MRAQDPLSELGLVARRPPQEDRFWQQTLASLAAHFGVEATSRRRSSASTQAAVVEGREHPALRRDPLERACSASGPAEVAPR